MMTSDVSILSARLARLEQRERNLRRIGWGALCLLPLGLGAFAGSGPGPVIRAEQVDLLTEQGVRRAALNADSSGVTLTLFTTRGRPVSALHLNDSTLALLDAKGQPVAILGGPRVRHLE
jgi:hypothetical protein